MTRLQQKHQPIVRPERDQAIVDTRDGELIIVRRAAAVIGWTAEPGQPAPSPRPPQLDPGVADVLVKAIERDCRTWFYILGRSKLPGEYLALKRAGQGARWLETAVNQATDYAPFEMERGPDGRMRKVFEKIHIKPAPPSPAELTWMDRMTDVLLTLRSDDLAWRLVTGRAQRVGWKELAAFDIGRRQVRQLQNLYRAALIKLMGPWLRTFHKI